MKKVRKEQHNCIVLNHVLYIKFDFKLNDISVILLYWIKSSAMYGLNATDRPITTYL